MQSNLEAIEIFENIIASRPEQTKPSGEVDPIYQNLFYCILGLAHDQGEIGNLEETIQTAQRAEDFALKHESSLSTSAPRILLQGLLELGVLHVENQDTEEAKLIFQQAQNIAAHINHEAALAFCLTQLADLAAKAGDHSIALGLNLSAYAKCHDMDLSEQDPSNNPTDEYSDLKHLTQKIKELSEKVSKPVFENAKGQYLHAKAKKSLDQAINTQAPTETNQEDTSSSVSGYRLRQRAKRRIQGLLFKI